MGAPHHGRAWRMLSLQEEKPEDPFPPTFEQPTNTQGSVWFCRPAGCPQVSHQITVFTGIPSPETSQAWSSPLKHRSGRQRAGPPPSRSANALSSQARGLRAEQPQQQQHRAQPPAANTAPELPVPSPSTAPKRASSSLGGQPQGTAVHLRNHLLVPVP